MTATKNGKKECPYCKGVPEALIEEAFVRAYNALCTYDGDFIDGFLEHIKKEKIAEINKSMDELIMKKQSLKDRQKGQQDINKRLAEFQKIIVLLI